MSNEEEHKRTCSLPEAGYRGQAFEVRAIDGNGIKFVVGWTNSSDGAPLVGMVNKHPTWKNPEVVKCRRAKGGKKLKE